jgi:membrane-bound acyltransferase YfiQ involved in biofilm formation
MSFAIYLVGSLILIGGLVYAAVLLAVPTQWIVAGVVVMLGLSILTAVKLTRQKDLAG